MGAGAPVFALSVGLDAILVDILVIIWIIGQNVYSDFIYIVLLKRNY